MNKHKEKLRVCLVGCGHIAHQHLVAWNKIDEARVIATCDINKKAAKSLAERWGISQQYTLLSEAIQQEDISIVDICTPPQTHRSLAVQALESGCHVLLEKPMTMTTKEADDIIHSQKVSGMRLGVIHNWLFEPTVLKIRSILRGGGIGNIWGAQIKVLSTNIDSMITNKDHWCHKLPGGRFGEMLAHPIYLLRDFLGPIKVENLSVAKMGPHPWVPWDELHIVFKCGNKLGTTYASFNSPRLVKTMDLYGTERILRVDTCSHTLLESAHILETPSSLALDVLRQVLQLSTSLVKNVGRFALGRWVCGHETYIRLFVKSLTEDVEPPVTLEEAYEVVRTIEEVCRRIPANGTEETYKISEA